MINIIVNFKETMLDAIIFNATGVQKRLDEYLINIKCTGLNDRAIEVRKLFENNGYKKFKT